MGRASDICLSLPAAMARLLPLTTDYSGPIAAYHNRRPTKGDSIGLRALCWWLFEIMLLSMRIFRYLVIAANVALAPEQEAAASGEAGC